MKSITFLLFNLCFLNFHFGIAQDVVPLWQGMEKPFYKENTLIEGEKVQWGTTCVFNITEPTLTIYAAKGENTGKAVIILPGGGYEFEAIYHEGYNVAAFLSERGITAAVLKYRLPNPQSSEQPQFVPISDARQALKLVRDKANNYQINKDQIGLMGFSAGSHLATITALWPNETKEEKPNFLALIYGVTDNSASNIKWIEESSYFRTLTPEELEQNNLLELVSEETPPAFLVHAYNDDVCPVSESTLFAQKLVDHGVLTEMHLFPKGGHGFGMGSKENGTDQWPELFVSWLKLNQF